jgi:hypothetical protein
VNRYPLLYITNRFKRNGTPHHQLKFWPEYSETALVFPVEKDTLDVVFKTYKFPKALVSFMTEKSFTLILRIKIEKLR